MSRAANLKSLKRIDTFWHDVTRLSGLLRINGPSVCPLATVGNRTALVSDEASGVPRRTATMETVPARLAS
jgi:hypothetical protein